MKRMAITAASSFAVVLGLALVVRAQSLAPQDTVPGEVLVVYKKGVPTTMSSQSLAAMGCRVIRYFEHVGVYHVSAAAGKTVAQTINELRYDPNVESASPNYIVHPFAPLPAPNDPSYPSQYGLNNRGNNIGALERYVDADADGFFTPGEVVVDDRDNSGTVSAGDVAVIGALPVLGTVLTSFQTTERFIDLNADARLDPADLMYRDVDGSALVSAGDRRLTGVMFNNPPAVYAAGSDVVANDRDIGVKFIAATPENSLRRLPSIGVIDADIDAPQGWAQTTDCSNEVVAVIDTGIDTTHPDFGGNAPAGNIWVNPNPTFDDVNGASFTAYEMYARQPAGDPRPYVTGDWIVLDNDGSETITVGDQRLTATAGGAAGTMVAALAPDIGTGLLNFTRFQYNAGTARCPGAVPCLIRERHLDADTNLRYENGEAVIQDLDNSGTISVGDVRSDATGGFPADSVVVAGNGDIGSAIVDFTRVVNGDVSDAVGHGTSVAGVIGAMGNNNLDIAGVCWRVQLMALKTLRPRSGGATSDIVGAINYIVARKMNGINVRVVNGSFGRVGPPDAQQAAANALDANGILFVVAAGNDTIDVDAARPNPFPPPAGNLVAPVVFPCGYVTAPNDSLICVGASDNKDNLAAFSNWGTTSVDLNAPGDSILTLRRRADGLGTRFIDGTSFSAPHVAGIAAHFFSLPGFGTHTPAQVKTRILTGEYGPIDTEHPFVGIEHPHGVDPRFGGQTPPNAYLAAPGMGTVVSGINNDGRARITCGDDFGDAPDPPYATLLASNGARHEDIGEEWLGRAMDLPANLMAPAGMSNVSPEFDATNDPSWPPDPDGVQNLRDIDNEMDGHNDGIRLVGPFIFSKPGGPPVKATVDVFITTENNRVVDADGGRYAGAHAAGDGVHRNTDNKFVWVNGFFDWNGNGTWDDANEHVFMLRADPSTWAPQMTHGGFYRVTFNMPAAPAVVSANQKWVRMRLDYGENAGQALAAPATAAGPSPGGLIRFWDDPGGLPFARGAAAANRYESIPAPNPPLLDLTRGLAQFGEVEDYKINFGDDYVCYNAFQREAPPVVTLTDALETNVQFRPRRGPLKSFCAPAMTNDVPSTDEQTHLKGYGLQRVVRVSPPRRTLDVTNQFGTFRVRTTGVVRLLVPGSKSLTDPPPIPDSTQPGFEYYKCYSTHLVGTQPAPFMVNVEDQFLQRQLTLRHVSRLCIPASLNGSTIKDPARKLLCFAVRRMTTPPDVFVKNIFGTGKTKLYRNREFCVPSSTGG